MKVKSWIVLFISITISLQSCMSYKDMFQVIPEQTAEEIPLKAAKIIIKNSVAIEENYNQSFKILLAQDYKIENSNKEMSYISASKMDLGDTNVRLNVVCKDKEINATSEWKAGQSSAMMATAMTGITINYGWENAKWYKRADKPSIAFAKAVTFSKELSQNLKYITQ